MTTTVAIAGTRATLRGHIKIARIDHWFKNVFVLPGLIAVLAIDRHALDPWLLGRIVIGLLSICLVASSNYVINEVLDAKYDLLHPVKSKRPVPSGQVSIGVAYAQWLALMVVGVGLGLVVGYPFAVTVFILWVMGCVYNIPPVRSKDLVYVDVLTEAINNPLRMLAGWFMVGTSLAPPASLLASYWMIGCFFMALKRYAEYRDIADPLRAAAYRRSFRRYTEHGLLVSTMFYASAAMLFLGAFIMRYRMEIILAFPLVALVMAVYLLLAFKPDSAVQRPEGLYKEPLLMAAVACCAVVIGLLLFVDIPLLHTVFSPTPTGSGGY
jgi:decaprenyl-phosphate phosphoribosyltransferase